MYCIIFLAVLAIDQIVKYLIVESLEINEVIPVIKGLLEITYLPNDKSALGLELFGGKMPVMIAITFVLLAALCVYYFKYGKSEHWTFKLSVSLIVSGGIGNLIDRVVRGFVVDMFASPGIWPFVFNVADASICIGCGLLLLYVIFFDKESKRENTDE